VSIRFAAAPAGGAAVVGTGSGVGLIAAGPGAALGFVVAGGLVGNGSLATELGGLAPLAGATVDVTVDDGVEVLEVGAEPGTVSAVPVLVTAVSEETATGAGADDVLEFDDPLQAPPPTASKAIATVFRSTASLSPLAPAINPHKR